MKKVLLLLAVCITALAHGQVGAKCQHCEMTIKDARFAAQAIEAGELITFDAIECLINYYLKKEGRLSEMQVTNYVRSDLTIAAESAYYVKSKKLPSPMGAYLTAYESITIAKKVVNEYGGEIFGWEEIKNRFLESEFGLISHPTHLHHRPDAYAPIGVMGDHLHHAGGWMMSLRYMYMGMEDNLQGSGKIGDEAVLRDYMVSPQTMNMGMLMLGVMYAPSDRLTIMLMQNFLRNEMSSVNGMDMDFQTESRGVGDMNLSLLFGLINLDRGSLHINTGVNLPIGDLQMTDDTPMMDDMKLPYPMQLGSGTVDYHLGVTGKWAFPNFSFGIQPRYTARTGENAEGYRFGNEVLVNAWSAYRLTSWVSTSFRVQAEWLSAIEGLDEELNPMMSPMADALNSGFERVRAMLGVNFSLGEATFFRDLKLGIEGAVPLYQHVEGVQMSESPSFVGGIRYSL